MVKIKYGVLAIFLGLIFSQDIPSFNSKRAMELLKMYRRSSDKIKVTFVDTFVDVQKRELYQIRNNGTIAFETNTDDRRELVTAVDEQKFTRAILKVTRGMFRI